MGLKALGLFFVPALVEEIVFRVWLLPHPVEGVPGGQWLGWAVVSTGLFVLFHWLLGKLRSKQGQATFGDPRFLILVGWLGLTLTGVYWITGSLGLIALLHWIVVMGWLYGLGGRGRISIRSA